MVLVLAAESNSYLLQHLRRFLASLYNMRLHRPMDLCCRKAVITVIQLPPSSGGCLIFHLSGHMTHHPLDSLFKVLHELSNIRHHLEGIQHHPTQFPSPPQSNCQ
ncbi:hypothetical protein V6N13_058687 [Hibiscus sabdariffa]